VSRRLLIPIALFLSLAGAVPALVLGATGGTAPTLSEPQGSTLKAQVKPSGCRVVPQPKARSEHLRPPPQTVDRSNQLLAVLETNCGRFTIKLDARRSPVIVNSFVYLARSGFYDGLSFYRVVPNFIVQGGDPTGKGFGGPGYHVIEPPPSNFRYRRGTVAMAKAAANPSGWSGSIFFVVLGYGGSVATEYAVLGRIDSGMGTVKRINRLGTGRETPRQVVRIDRVRIHRTG
jgi:cyclophilin family peptidyl-prolyl cis-trans isomerase